MKQVRVFTFKKSRDCRLGVNLLTQCPHCGDDTGYYTYAVVSGKATCQYTWEGKDGNNTEMHEGIQYRELKTKRCSNCHRIIPKRKFNGMA